MCFLVEKYVPSAQNQHTVVDGADNTPKLPPSEEGTLAITDATEKDQTPVLEAGTVASTGAPNEPRGHGLN